MAATSLKDLADKSLAGTGVQAVTQNFDESKGVAARVNQITSTDSPLMKTAATQGTQAAAKRGLTNSSIGVESAQQAVINAATPIATADASLYGQNSLANLAAKNQAANSTAQNNTTVGTTALNLENSNTQHDKSLAMNQQQVDIQRDALATEKANFDKQLSQQQAQFTTSLQSNNKNFDADLAQRNAALVQQKVLAVADNELRTKLAQMDSTSRADVQGNLNISNAWGTMMANIQAIQNNPNLDGPAKKTLIDNTMASFQSFTNFWKKTSGGTVDVSDLLNFGPEANKPIPAPPPSGPAVPSPGQYDPYNGVNGEGGGE
jgi:hypothetical protein